jgi:hypothetical protein
VTERAVREVWLATPCHGQPSMGYAQSFQPTVSMLAKLGYGIVPRIVQGQAHIDLIRSGVASRFLRSPTRPDVLIWIDSDEEWSPVDVLVLLEGIEQGLDVVGAAVPGKLYDWEAIRVAALHGTTASDLETQGLVFAYELDGPDVDAHRGYIGPTHLLPRSAATLIRVRHCGTGFLALHRSVLDRVATAHPELAYDAPMPGVALFKSEVLAHATGKRHETEDYSLLHRYRKLGGTIWLHYAARIGHEGLHTWRGDGSDASLKRQAQRFAHITRTPGWRDYP